VSKTVGRLSRGLVGVLVEAGIQGGDDGIQFQLEMSGGVGVGDYKINYSATKGMTTSTPSWGGSDQFGKVLGAVVAREQGLAMRRVDEAVRNISRPFVPSFEDVDPNTSGGIAVHPANVVFITSGMNENDSSRRRMRARHHCRRRK
jgi:hypothetical protein